MHDVKAECPACGRLHFPWCEPHDTADTATSDVLAEVAAERRRQDATWGIQRHPDGTGHEYWQAQRYLWQLRCERRAAEGTLTWLDILMEEVSEALAETDPTLLRTELLQVAAVAAAWVEALDRRTEEDTRG